MADSNSKEHDGTDYNNFISGGQYKEEKPHEGEEFGYVVLEIFCFIWAIELTKVKKAKVLL